MNKKILILNGVWLVVAIAAFALGRFDSGSSTADDGGTKFSGKASNTAGADAKSSRKEKSEESEESAGKPVAGEVATLQVAPTGPLSPDDMRQAVIDALNETNPLKSNLLFAQLLDRLTLDNIEAAMDALRENADGQAMFRHMGLFTFAYGAMDGEKAIAYAQSIEGRGSTFTTASALSGWASANPQAAMEWLKSQDGLEGMEKAMFARGLVTGLAQTDLKLATQYALTVTDPEMKRQFFDVIAREQVGKGIESASAWVNTLPDDTKSNALEIIAREYSRKDLDAAELWVAKYANEPYGARAVAEIADEVAEIDPSRALQLVYNLPAGEAQANAMAAAFREITRSDFEQANNLLNQMQASPLRDYATASFIEQARREDPQGALALASTISDPALKVKSQISALAPVYRTDPNAALQQAAAIGLSAEAQAQLVEAANRSYSDFGRGDGFRGPPPGFGGGGFPGFGGPGGR